MWWSAPSAQNSTFTEVEETLALSCHLLKVVACALPGAPTALNLNKGNLGKRKILVNVVPRIVCRIVFSS